MNSETLYKKQSRKWTIRMYITHRTPLSQTFKISLNFIPPFLRMARIVILSLWYRWTHTGYPQYDYVSKDKPAVWRHAIWIHVSFQNVSLRINCSQPPPCPLSTSSLISSLQCTTGLFPLHTGKDINTFYTRNSIFIYVIISSSQRTLQNESCNTTGFH